MQKIGSAYNRSAKKNQTKGPIEAVKIVHKMKRGRERQRETERERGRERE